MYFANFPKVSYKTGGNTSDVLTNIMFRVGVAKAVKNNIFGYYNYEIRDGERPDTIAEKYYGNSEYHWLIFLANDMIDPISQWPKDYLSWINYMNSEYGSLSVASSTIHHYENVITRNDPAAQTINNFTIEVDKATYDALPATSYRGINLTDGSTIIETTQKNAITIYNFEQTLNESRRNIKVIKKDYLPTILSEFKDLTAEAKKPVAGRRVLNI